MAIKGKKKSQSRGSQARRRPAAAPRPTTGAGAKKRWYQTTAGQSIAAITALVVVVIGLVLVNNARTAAEEADLRRQSLENFTEQVRALVETVSEPASELAAAGQTPPDELRRSAENWRDAFTAAQTQAAQFPPAEGTTTAHQLFAQSLNLYRGAAVLFLQAAEAEADAARTEMLAVAAGQVASAESVWMAAVAVLDAARDAEDMSASGVTAPSQPSAGEMPDATATIPIEPGGESTGEGQGGQGGGGNDDQDDDS